MVKKNFGDGALFSDHPKPEETQAPVKKSKSVVAKNIQVEKHKTKKKVIADDWVVAQFKLSKQTKRDFKNWCEDNGNVSVSVQLEKILSEFVKSN